MPALHEWMLHYPTDWTPAQAGQYTNHVFRQLVNAITPVNQALGASKTAGILLATIGMLAKANPLSARDICVQMANAFEIIEGLDPLVGATKQ